MKKILLILTVFILFGCTSQKYYTEHLTEYRTITDYIILKQCCKTAFIYDRCTNEQIKICNVPFDLSEEDEIIIVLETTPLKHKFLQWNYVDCK